MVADKVMLNVSADCESRIYRLKSTLPWIRKEFANDQYRLVHVVKNWIGAKYDIER